MRKFLFVLSVFTLSFYAKAQNFVPDSIAEKQVTISLKGKFQGLIVGFMKEAGGTDFQNYSNDLKKQIVGAAFDTSQIFTSIVSYKFFASVYYKLSVQNEGVTAPDNAAMKDDMITQLMIPEHYDLIAIIQRIDEEHKKVREAVRSQGIQYIMSLKL
jgi:hypothetical protein